MKKISNLLLALPLLAAVSFVFVGCSKDDPIKEEEVKETPTLSIATKNYEVSGAGETVKISVMTNQTLSVSVTESWVHAQVTDAKTVSVTIDASEEYEQRTADVTIKGGMLSETVKITQKGSQILTLDKAEHTVPANGGTITIETKSNFDYEIIMPNVDWIKQSETRSLTTAKVSFDVLANETTDSREATIVFKDKNSSTEKSLKVVQEPKPVLSVANNTFEIEDEGGTFSVDVTANVGYDVKISDVWIKQTKSGAESKKLSFTVEKMTESDEDRTGTIELTNKNAGLSQKITVTQKNLSQIIEFKTSALRDYLVERYDVNHDKKISIKEIKKVEYLELTEMEYSSSKGLEHFPNLKHLVFYKVKFDNYTLDVSGCTALQKLEVNNFSLEKWRLKSLNVSGCTELTELDCGHNNLTSLDVSNLAKLKKLNCRFNKLTSLNVNGCTSLTELECDLNNLTSLNVSGCTELTVLNCDNNNLTSLDVSNLAKLEKLYCYENQLTSLNVSGCTELTELWCYKNKIESLSISGFTKLESLICYENKLTSLNVNGCTELTSLSCGVNRIESLDVSDCTKLNFLTCGRNYELTSFNVSGCTELIRLECNKNQIESLDVSGFTKLRILYCQENQLTSLKVSGCKSLTELHCGNNKITSLDVSSCTALVLLICINNQIASLNVSGCTAMYELRCGNNKLTSLDISSCTALQLFDCLPNESLTSIAFPGGKKFGRYPSHLK